MRFENISVLAFSKGADYGNVKFTLVKVLRLVARIHSEDGSTPCSSAAKFNNGVMSDVTCSYVCETYSSEMR